MFKIAIIDDDDIIRENLTELLTSYSFSATAYEDADTAIKEISAAPPDLILCDIMMPQTHGYEVLNILKENEKTSCIPFIFITAKAEIADIRVGMEMGADDYLIKPFTKEQLLTAINTRKDAIARVNRKKETDLQSSLDNLSQVISHEYNTPLNGIIGLSDVLLETIKNKSFEEVVKCIQLIKESGLRLKRMNHKLINFITTFNNVKPLSPNIITIEEFQNITSTIIKRIAREQNRENDSVSAAKLSNQTSYIVFPTLYLETIIEEIAFNAFKFSNKGTPVNINFSLEPKSQICISIKNTSIEKPNFIRDETVLDFKRTKNGGQGLTMGLLMIDKLCALQNCIFVIEEFKLMVKASFKIKYLNKS
jgi:two-component system sensor histidine kinase/response regulator